MGQIKNIEIARGIAALIVVAFHAEKASMYYFDNKGLGNVFKSLHSGVDFFFVLSGFIMFLSWSKIKKSFFKYIIGRIKRIYPIYLVVFLINLVFYLGKTDVDDINLRYLVFSAFLIPQNESPLVIVAWTLTYEIFFYLVFSVFYINKFIAKGLVLFWMIGSLFALFIFDLNFPYEFIFSAFNLQFGLGILAAYLHINFVRLIKHAKLLVIFGLSSFFLVNVFEVLSSDLFLETLGHPELSSFWRLLYGVPAFFIIVGISWVPSVENHRFATFLGAASYSVYLVHNDAISLIVKLIRKLDDCNLFDSSLSLLPILFIFSLLLSLLFYLLIDKNIQRLLSSQK
jgi:exopolysaccharide production protein ExoZ